MNARKTELNELVEAYLENRLSEAEAEELRQQLRLSHEARLLFWECMEQHALLEEVLGENRGRDLAQFDVPDPLKVPAGEIGCEPTSPTVKRPTAWLPWGSALITLAAGLLLVIGFQRWGQVPPLELTLEPAVGTVELVAGDIRVCDRTGQSVVATAGLVLRPGQVIASGEEDSLAELHFNDGTQVTLSSGSSLRLPGSDRSQPVEPLQLDRGVMRVQISRPRDSSPLIVATDHGRITASEGRFRLYREEKGSRVEVEDGQVSVLSQQHDQIVEERSYVVATGDPNPMESRLLPSSTCRLLHTFLRVGDAMVLAQDGSQLVTHHQKHGLRFWNVADGKLLITLPGSREPISSLALSRSGQAVTGLGQNGLATLWRLGENAPSQTRLRDRNLRQSAISLDGRWLVQGTGAGTGEVAFWEADTESGRISQRRSLDIKPSRVALSHDGAYLAVNQWAGETSVWEVATDRKLAQPHLPGTAALAISTDGSTLAAFTNQEGLVLLNHEMRSRRTLWPREGARICHLLFSVDGRVILAALNDGTVRAWACDDGQSLLVLETGHRNVLWIAASTDLSLLATRGDQDCVKLWEWKRP